ncbi:fatty acid synthase alpha subunit FasA [Apiospora hydei]|uniref:beta-ketoacyl-[acyl-carrier-protein] synthase I n=1 Tax=Apiospora hydei TaxID=1337664 RepID=A0ABR1XB94_9PEZI
MTIIQHEAAPVGEAKKSPQEISYDLLVELLTYQFAFPVQWIDTQKELLTSYRNVRRLIEIGPANVLANMAKKSAKALVSDQDMARSVEREYLNINNPDDARKIYYEYDENTKATETVSAAPAAPAVQAPMAAPVKVPDAPPVAIVPVPTAPGTIVDKDLSPTDIILTLVAQKLRRAFDEVPVGDTIQGLSGGKSTLQNELIGDLAAEFGDLPDGSESTAIATLGEKLSSGFSGKLGASSKKLVERFVSSKMPAGFGQTEMMTYIASRWGLGANSRVAVQCFCVTMEPPSRLSDVGQAHALVDSVVSRYAKHAGVTLPTPSSGGGGTPQGGLQNAVVQVDNASLEALKSEQNDILRKQLQVLAEHLGIEITPDVASGAEVNSDHQKKLDQIYTELDEEFITDVQGTFDARKERRYSSWWNWVREDAARILQQQNVNGPVASKDRLQALANRWTAELEDMLRHRPPVFHYFEPAMAPHTSVDEEGTIHYTEVAREGKEATYFDAVSSTRGGGPCSSYVHCLRRDDKSTTWQYDCDLTKAYLDALFVGNTSGLTYVGKTALVTGAGIGSIGIEVVRGLLSGGTRVIVTTSRSPASAGSVMSQLYKEVGAQGSELILLPFNAASKKDVEELIAHIYGDKGGKSGGLGADLDFVIPFAAIPELGREIEGLDARSEVAHRAMLTNVLRLMGCIKQHKENRNYTGRPTTLVLPLSPNHGDFGGDGLYSESKIGLETLFNRYRSEQWSDYLSVIGAVIGWTRGTGLMSANNIVAEGIEKLGVMTFTAGEMAFNILALLSPAIIRQSDSEPVYADLSGGLVGFPKLKEEIMAIREEITGNRRERQAITAERKKQEAVIRGLKAAASPSAAPAPKRTKRSNITQGFPKLSSHQTMTAGLESLTSMVDLSRTAVVVGFSELGPWGSSRTRWQMESQGKLNQDGLTEMAWIMGLIKHHDGPIDGKPYVGWLDVESGKPVEEADFAARYGEHILTHSGIRTIEPDGMDGYDPSRKELLHELVLDHDLPPFETSATIAQSFKLRHGKKVKIFPSAGASDDSDGNWTVIINSGATFLVPKSTDGHNSVAAQLPKGWNAATYGIPEDIIAQVDPVTLYVLCCACEAMFSAGIEDPFELYRHVHVSELGNYIGTGAGSLQSARAMYRSRYHDQPVQGDILQETFLNSMAAWTNLLLFGSTGPIKTPTGTCATSVESLDNACEAIRSRRVKVALVGGSDDLREEMSHEFSNMKATVNGDADAAKGHLPSQASRPTASSRAGFVESAGCGVQIVMSAELALKMGLPIHAVVAYTQMAGDGVGRSVPAPGQGVLTAARGTAAALRSPLLDTAYRRSQLERELATIEASKLSQLAITKENGGDAHQSMIESAAACCKADAQWNIDDIAVASFHGTSTKANDKNESAVINQQMAHLGRTAGNPLLVVCQKALTGHPKGAAGAWMLNGCLQILESGLVPGNRNADDVDAALRAFPHLLYPSEAIELGGGSGVKAFMLTSFGFGQKGGIVIGVTPRALYGALSEYQYEAYRAAVGKRRRRADRAFQLAMMTNTVFKAKDRSAWVEAGRSEKDFLLDPTARVVV